MSTPLIARIREYNLTHTHTHTHTHKNPVKNTTTLQSMAVSSSVYDKLKHQNKIVKKNA